MVKIVNKWLSKRGKYEIGLDKSGKMFCRSLEDKTTMMNGGIKIKQSKAFNIFIHPTTKHVVEIERHC